MRDLFFIFVVCVSINSASAEGDSVEDQINAHCSALGRIAFLAVEKYKTGREIEDVKKELAAVVKSAAAATNDGNFFDQFLKDYDTVLADVYATKQRKATEYAIAYIRECKRR